MESAQKAVRERCRKLEESGFRQLAVRRDVHKRREHLSFTGPRTNFEHWYGSVIREAQEPGSLEGLVGSFGTSEEAHERMKPWLMVKRVRSINAADGARLLSHHGYVAAEERPLLAAGGLRGAALFLDEVDPRFKISQVEYRYRDEVTRRGLEERAGAYLRERFPGIRMEEGENWLCEVFHKGMFPVGRRRG